MPTVLPITPLRNVHDIDVKSTKGRAFVIDIYESVPDTYDSTVTVLDGVSNPPGSWLYNTQPATASANDNFKSALELISKYLAARTVLTQFPTSTTHAIVRLYLKQIKIPLPRIWALARRFESIECQG